eukprot:scaffold5640_cov328-Prasinococcus_capsulatus_cf.AAC.1
MRSGDAVCFAGRGRHASVPPAEMGWAGRAPHGLPGRTGGRAEPAPQERAPWARRARKSSPNPIAGARASRGRWMMALDGARSSAADGGGVARLTVPRGHAASGWGAEEPDRGASGQSRVGTYVLECPGSAPWDALEIKIWAPFPEPGTRAVARPQTSYCRT